VCGPGSSVGIATELRAGRSEIESWWRRDFPPVQTGSGAHPASCKMGTDSFSGVKCGRAVLLTTHPLLVSRSWKSRAIYLYPSSGPHRAFNGITLPLCVWVYIYIYIYIYIETLFRSLKVISSYIIHAVSISSLSILLCETQILKMLSKHLTKIIRSETTIMPSCTVIVSHVLYKQKLSPFQ